MERGRARGRLPQELEGLLASQVAEAIREANLGLSDTQIARRRYIDQLQQMDIAVEMGLSRSAVTKRLGRIEARVCEAASRFPQ